VNLEKFNLLMGGFKKKELGQDPSEWRNFLGFCSDYFSSRGISRPLVVEIGIWNGLQRRFYEQILGAEYIGIDNGNPFAPITIKDGSATPEIFGDSHNPATVEKLLRRLAGRRVDLLFIDGDHAYESVRQDFELYAPLTQHIVAFHDMIGTEGVARFWNELVAAEKSRPFVIFYKDSSADWTLQMGIGLYIKGE
jgi:hypothetical protein